jgi:hypothetical protein
MAPGSKPDRIVVIEAPEGVAHGLPPVRIRLDLEGLPFLPWSFPDARTYFSLSGPPGGPLFFSAHPLPPDVRDAAALAALVSRTSGGRASFQLGAGETIEYRRSSCLAQLFFSGSEHAATASCALAVPAAGLLFVFGHGGNPGNVPDCRSIAASPPLAAVLERLAWG